MVADGGAIPEQVKGRKPKGSSLAGKRGSLSVMSFRPLQTIQRRKDRTDIFADACLSIIFTIGILRIHAPKHSEVGNDHFWEELWHQKWMYLAHVLTVHVVGFFWVGHVHTTEKFEIVDRFLSWITVAFLLSVSVLPFGSAVLGLNAGDPTAVRLYAAILVPPSFLLFSILVYAHSLSNKSMSSAELNNAKLRILSPPAVCVLVLAVSVFSRVGALSILIMMPFLYLLTGTRWDPFWTIMCFYHRRIKRSTDGDSCRITRFTNPMSRRISSARVEGFGDSTIAIVITLLAVEVPLPNTDTSSLWESLKGLGKHFLSYFLAVIVVAQFWITHVFVYRLIEKSDALLMWINVWYLLFVSLLPFSSLVLGEFYSYPGALVVFCGNLTLAGLCMAWSLHHAITHDLMQGHLSVRARFAGYARTLLQPVTYSIAAGLAYVSPVLSFVLIAMTVLMYFMAAAGVDAWVPVINWYMQVWGDKLEGAAMSRAEGDLQLEIDDDEGAHVAVDVHAGADDDAAAASQSPVEAGNQHAQPQAVDQDSQPEAVDQDAQPEADSETTVKEKKKQDLDD